LHRRLYRKGPECAPAPRVSIDRGKATRVACELPVVYFQFDSDDAVGSFTVNVRLVAANIRKPSAAALHVVVTRAESGAPPLPPEPGEEPEE
jgi:hypothetical protein